MSFRAVTWAFDQIRGLGATEKLVLLALAEFANDENITWRSQAEIAARAECAARSVKTYLAKLEARGLIDREPRYAWCSSSQCEGRTAHKHRSGTTYKLNLAITKLRPLVCNEEPTSANVAPVEQSAESSGKVHRGKSCTCDPNQSPQVQPGVPHRCNPQHPYESVNPQLNPHTNQPTQNHQKAPKPATVTGGMVGTNKKNKLTPRIEPAHLDLIRSCLPAIWCRLDRNGATEIAQELQARLDAGWTTLQIRKAMGTQIPPQNYTRLSGVLKHRLDQHVVPELAPKNLQTARKQPQQAVAIDEPTNPAKDEWSTHIWETAWNNALKLGLSKLDAMKSARETIENAGLSETRFVERWTILQKKNPNLSNREITKLTIETLKRTEGAPMSR